MAWTRFGKKKDMPGGLWIKCESCGGMLFRKEFEQYVRGDRRGAFRRLRLLDHRHAEPRYAQALGEG